MFERFTEKARRVVVHAQETARGMHLDPARAAVEELIGGRRAG